MVRFDRFESRTAALAAGLMLVVATAVATHLALQPQGSEVRHDGFLAYGRISVAIPRDALNTVQTRRCMADSAQAGIQVRQGTPVIISLDGDAVGGGDVSTGELIKLSSYRGSPHSLDISCRYKFSAPVVRRGDGQYTVDIGEARIAFSTDELRNGIDLHLS